MANKWRPQGYKPLHSKEFIKEKQPSVQYQYIQNNSIYEAGYDQCLEDLRNKGVHVNRDASFSSLGEHTTISNEKNTGTYLFIPDDEVKK